jgi:WD40 repeat protein
MTRIALSAICLAAAIAFGPLARPCCGWMQAETVVATASAPVYVSRGRVEGHLALNYSPAAAFSPDSRYFAIVSDENIALMDLREGTIAKVLHLRLGNIFDLEIESANFLNRSSLLVLARGGMQPKGSLFAQRTPLLAFQWTVDEDKLTSKVSAVGAGGGFAPILYLPRIGYVGMYKESKISLWDPRTDRGAVFTIQDLAHKPGLFVFSPNAPYVVLARVEGNSSPDPMVVNVKERKFVDVLAGHHGTVLDVAFSPDGQRVVTACEDGMIRVWQVADWKLVHTLTGHVGPVHWAEFSPDGKWIVSAGEDKSARIWSAEDGRLLQTLSESRDPLLTAAFSPDGRYVAASAEQSVLVWERKQ